MLQSITLATALLEPLHFENRIFVVPDDAKLIAWFFLFNVELFNAEVSLFFASFYVVSKI